MECKNCSAILDPQSDFCQHCGAQVIRHRLTAKHLFRHFIETFFSYDNKFLRTIVFLFKNPKDVIDSYVQGVRKKYIAPLAFFAIAITLSSIYLFILKKYYPDFFVMADSLHKTDVSREIGRKVTDVVTEYNSLINFMIIPFMALISKLVFLKKRYNFTEHLVIYFYTMSLLSIVSVINNLFLLTFFQSNFLELTSAIYFLFFVYQCFVLKQIFALSLRQLLIKILLFLPLFFVFYIVASIVIFLLVFVLGDYSLQDLAPQP